MCVPLPRGTTEGRQWTGDPSRWSRQRDICGDPILVPLLSQRIHPLPSDGDPREVATTGAVSSTTSLCLANLPRPCFLCTHQNTYTLYYIIRVWTSTYGRRTDSVYQRIRERTRFFTFQSIEISSTFIPAVSLSRDGSCG